MGRDDCFKSTEMLVTLKRMSGFKRGVSACVCLSIDRPTMKFISFLFWLGFLFLALLAIDLTVFQRVLHPAHLHSSVATVGSTFSSFLDQNDKFKPLENWSPEELAVTIQGSSSHRALTAVASVILDQRLDGDVLSTAFSSPTTTTG
jgi:hypothetical protein